MRCKGMLSTFFLSITAREQLQKFRVVQLQMFVSKAEQITR